MENSAVPKVSVIIPLYNKAPYIKRALDSVFAQTVQDFEVIVVNDGSKDGGEKIVEEYGDSRIHLINQENQGVSAARNHGVDAARAELVAFLDADDEWLPNFLETILELRAKYPHAGLYGTGYKRISTNSDEITCSLNFEEEGGEITYFKEKLQNPLMIILTSGMVIPKRIFSDVGGFPVGYPQNEDRCLRAKIALRYSVIYSPKICLIYYVDATNTIKRFQDGFIKDSFTEYVNENKSKLLIRDDWIDIKEFCNVATLSVMSGNLKSTYYDKEVRTILKNIDTERYKLERVVYFYSSYLPKKIRPVMLTLIQHYSTVKHYFFGINP